MSAPPKAVRDYLGAIGRTGAKAGVARKARLRALSSAAMRWVTGEGGRAMTTVISELYAALKAARSDDGARRASEVVASYENRFARIEVKVERLERRLRLIQWLLALSLAGVASLVIKAFF